MEYTGNKCVKKQEKYRCFTEKNPLQVKQNPLKSWSWPLVHLCQTKSAVRRTFDAIHGLFRSGGGVQLATHPPRNEGESKTEMFIVM